MSEREGEAGEGEEAEVVAAVLGEVEEVVEVEVVVTIETSMKSWPVLGAAKVTTHWTLLLIDAAFCRRHSCCSIEHCVFVWRCSCTIIWNVLFLFHVITRYVMLKVGRYFSSYTRSLMY
jgi:hypothetical protein